MVSGVGGSSVSVRMPGVVDREISVETDIPLEDDEDTYTSPYLELSSGGNDAPVSTLTSFRDINRLLYKKVEYIFLTQIWFGECN